MVIASFLEQAKKSVVDDSRQLRVLKKCDLVNELQLVVRFFRAVTSHRHVHEQSLKVRLGNLVKKLAMLCLIEVFDQNYFFVYPTRRIWVSLLLHWRVASRRRSHTDKWASIAADWLCLREGGKVACLIGGAWTATTYIDPLNLLANLLGLCLGCARLLAWRIIRFHSGFNNFELFWVLIEQLYFSVCIPL